MLRKCKNTFLHSQSLTRFDSNVATLESLRRIAAALLCSIHCAAPGTRPRPWRLASTPACRLAPRTHCGESAERTYPLGASYRALVHRCDANPQVFVSKKSFFEEKSCGFSIAMRCALYLVPKYRVYFRPSRARYNSEVLQLASTPGIGCRVPHSNMSETAVHPHRRQSHAKAGLNGR